MQIISLPSDTTIQVGVAPSVLGDEVRMIPDATSQTLIGFTFVEVTNMALPQMTITDTSVTALPWAMLEGQLAGAGGAPTSIGAGPLTADSDNAFIVLNGAPSVPMTLVVGFTQLAAPFKGGMLVPSPDVLVNLATNVDGGLTLPFAWPGGVPSGFSLFYQAWLVDPSGPNGLTATNALQAVTP